MPLTAERLRELLNYDPLTGVFTRLKDVPGPKGAVRVRAGSVSGWKDGRGYMQLSVDGRPYRAHRLAWLYVYGVWPSRLIDHIDFNGLNNRIVNLRIATRSENAQNRKGAQANSKSGVLGVCWNDNEQKWLVQLSLDGKKVHFSRHHTIENAITARRVAELRFHQFASVRSPCQQ